MKKDKCSKAEENAIAKTAIRMDELSRFIILDLREKLIRTEIEVLELRKKLSEVMGRREVGI